MIRSILVSIFVVAVLAGVLYLSNEYPDAAIPESVGNFDVPGYIMQNFEADTGARNAVAAIYLNYRVYDTLFEALLLLIAIVGIIHFFRIGIRNEEMGRGARVLRKKAAKSSVETHENAIVTQITGFLYPVIILFGLYIILNGHNTPGGGFQGGAILATLFIGRFIVDPVNDINAELLHDVEQSLFVMIVIFAVAFLFYQLNTRFPQLNEAFLILMNLLIGIKVCLGLTIVVFRFGFDEEIL